MTSINKVSHVIKVNRTTKVRPLRLALTGLLIAISIMLLGMPSSAAASGEPDIIHLMTVVLYPQPDGKVKLVYHFDYEATTFWPKDFQKIQIGVANNEFRILNLGADRVPQVGRWRAQKHKSPL